MHKNYLYSVTDKALFDALNTSKITNNELRDLFLSRGVIISTDTERQDLAKEFSKYNHDYYDHQKIASAMGVVQRKEKSTNSDYITSADSDALEQSLNALKTTVEQDKDLCIWYENENGDFIVDITYETPDYTKSEFKQIVKKEASIVIEKTDDGYTVRYPDNPRVKDYERVIRESLSESAGAKGESFDAEFINLAAIDDPNSRTQFFKDLLYRMKNYDVLDVTDVYVYHPQPKEEHEKKIGESGIHITRAALKGEGVLHAGQLQSFYEDGYYISKIRWKFEECIVGSDIYDAEAMFDDPKNFEGFSYIVRGKYKYKGKGEYNKNPTKLDIDEELVISRVIEQTARSISDEIISKALKESENEPSETESTTT